MNLRTIKENKYWEQFDFGLWSTIGGYIILGTFLFPYFKYVINADAVSYISIAQKYSNGDYLNAINGYWSPLWSWLLVPFILFGIEPLSAAHILSLMIGLLVIVQVNSLIDKVGISPLFKKIILYLIGFNVLDYALAVLTPDLLFVLFSLACLNALLDPSYLQNKYSGVKLGWMGAGIYLAKSFGFPFFISIFFITNLVFYLRDDIKKTKRIVRGNFVLGMIVFSMLSLCWVCLISNKYQRVTISTAGSYNHFSGWDIRSNEDNRTAGSLTAPPNNTAISSWEDPSLKESSNLVSIDKEKGKRQLGVILKNCAGVMETLIYFSFLCIPFLLIAAIYLSEQGRKMFWSPIFFMFLFSFILIGGYLLLVIRLRYLWLSQILLMVIAAKLLLVIIKKTQLKNISITLIMIFFIFGFSYRSIYSFLLVYPGVVA